MDIERQMTAAEDNLLGAIIRNGCHDLRHLFPSEKLRSYDLHLVPVTLLYLQKCEEVHPQGLLQTLGDWT